MRGMTLPLAAERTAVRWHARRDSRILLLGVLGVLLQQIAVPYTAHLFGVTESASLLHLHTGLLLALVMLERDRVVQAGVFGVVFLGWVVRATVLDYDMTVWLPMGAGFYFLSWLWMMLCAAWMGWPQAQRRMRVGKRDLARFAGIGLVLCPLGLAAIALLVELFIGRSDQLADTAQVLFAKYFGITVLTFPLVMAWCERHTPRPRALRWQDGLLPALLVLALAISILASTRVESAFAALGGKSGVVLMDYRFALFALLGWCALRLRPRYSMALLVMTMFVLVQALASTAARNSTPAGFVNLLHLAFELGVLLMAMLYFIVFERDSREAAQRLVEETLRDNATGLPNLAALRREIGQRRLTGPGEVGFLVLDHAGDLVAGFGLDMQSQVMNTVAARLAGINRTYLVGMGQFALLPDESATREEAGADPWAGTIAAIETIEVDSGGQRFALSPYLGVARRIESSLEAAEAALLRASQLAFEARNRNEVHPLRDEDASSPQSGALRQRLHVANDALACLRSRRVELHFQSIRPLDPAHPVCNEPEYAVGEVLCRLRGADGRLIMPDEFLGPVEAMGRNVELDLVVITELFELLRAYPQALPKIRRLAVNLTGQSLASLGFKRQFEALLADSPLPLSSLCFEITENAVISAEAHTRSFLDDLHERGCRMAIDDFGKGMQSFGRLKELPVDIIKIDGAFIRHVAQRGRDYALVEASMSIARAFNAETVAEFVEDQATVDCLRELGVDWMQGYLHARPQPLAELLAKA